MQTDSSVKALVKILIGAAWIDGKVQPEEHNYLVRVAAEKGVADDPEIQSLLHELKAVTPDECYSWINAYLGDRRSAERCQQLLEAISGLIYSDGTVATEEARLLTNLQALETTQGESMLSAIRDLYQRWVAKINA